MKTLEFFNSVLGQINWVLKKSLWSEISSGGMANTLWVAPGMVVAQSFNPSTWEAEVSLRYAVKLCLKTTTTTKSCELLPSNYHFAWDCDELGPWLHYQLSRGTPCQPLLHTLARGHTPVHTSENLIGATGCSNWVRDEPLAIMKVSKLGRVYYRN